MSKSKAKAEKPSPHVSIRARDLRNIVKDEIYRRQLQYPDDVPDERIKLIAKTIVKLALLSPR